MKRRTAWVLVAAVAAVSVGAAIVGAIALMMRGPRGLVMSGGAESYLSLTLAGEIPEQPASQIAGLLERQPPSLRTLVESLDRASRDPQIGGLVVRVNVLPASGWAKAQELRDAITRFRKSGKPAYAHLEYSGNLEYYLASACDKIYAVPTALMDVSGLAFEVTFFKKTFDKLGVQAQFEGVGRYKNAPNQFTETGFTEAHREQMEELLDSLFHQYVTAIAEGRGKSADEVRELIDDGPYDAKRALEAGLVDELVYQDQLDAKLKNASRISAGSYMRSARGFDFVSRPRLALVYAVGEIVPGESQQSAFGGEYAGSDTIARALQQARTDDAVKAIVLRVDSPGGSGTASDVIWREVELTKKVKPVVISMGDYAASGGYYIAMGGDVIVAQPGTITGSIGVFGGKFSLRGLFDKVGLTRETLVRGRHADIFSEYRPWSTEERAKIRELMVAFYEDFVGKVAEGRHKSVEEADALAQGRVWSGAEAFANGLVDRLGGLDEALKLARERARIRADQDIDLLILPEKKSFIEMFLEHQDDEVVASALPADMRAMLRWARLLAEGGPVARVPFEMRVR
jgi:protease-4